MQGYLVARLAACMCGTFGLWYRCPDHLLLPVRQRPDCVLLPPLLLLLEGQDSLHCGLPVGLWQRPCHAAPARKPRHPQPLVHVAYRARAHFRCLQVRYVTTSAIISSVQRLSRSTAVLHSRSSAVSQVSNYGVHLRLICRYPCDRDSCSAGACGSWASLHRSQEVEPAWTLAT